MSQLFFLTLRFIFEKRKKKQNFVDLKSSIYRTVIVHYRAEGVLEEGRGKQDLTLLSVPYQITTNLKALILLARA